MFPTASQKMLIIPTTHKMPAPNYNPQHNFKVCKFKIWLSPTSMPRASLSKLPMIPHLQKCRCQSAHTKIRQTDPDHLIQTKYHIYNKDFKYKPLHTCNNYDCSLSWLGTGTSINSGRIKLYLIAQISPSGLFIWELTN